jgi:hypothetical protein
MQQHDTNKSPTLLEIAANLNFDCAVTIPRRSRVLVFRCSSIVKPNLRKFSTEVFFVVLLVDALKGIVPLTLPFHFFVFEWL